MNNSKDNKVTGSKFIGFLKKHKTLCIFLAIIATLTVAYGILEFNFQQKVNTVKNEVMRVEKTIVQPAGGGNSTELSVHCPHYIDSTGWITIPCPSASQAWYVAVDKDKSLGSYIADVFKEMGYTNYHQITDYKGHGSSTAFTGELAISTSLEDVNVSDGLYKLPESKKWVKLTVDIYRTSYKVGQK